MEPTPVFLPGEFHGQSSLVSHDPKCCKQSDMTEQLNTQCIRPKVNRFRVGKEHKLFPLFRTGGLSF